MFERIRQARRSARERDDLSGLIQDCRDLLTVRGDSNSTAIAARALERYRRLPHDALPEFFDALADEFNPDPGRLLELAERYAVARTPENLIRLAQAAEPPRQELFRRLNLAPEGTGTIIAMRAAILQRLRQVPRLRAVDADLEHLLGSWFNPGFLNLVQVDWGSPARLLEKIIHHEAVHEIEGWNDLRRRLEPDRRCFAFLHPMLPDEPLIFVEVALVPDLPAAIAPLLDRRGDPCVDPGQFKVAAFYSISNCQPGLRGVNLGNFLIKRVAQQLNREFPKLKTFCTLSPVPSFAGWLLKLDRLDAESAPTPAKRRALEAALQGLRDRHGDDLSGLHEAQVQRARALREIEHADEEAAGEPALAAHERAARRLRTALRGPSLDEDSAAIQRLAAHYLLRTSAGGQAASDPVARFHLNNGARLERINLLGDVSRKGLRQSFGVMVNYLYDLDQIEANHERFVAGEVTAARTVLGLA